MGSNVSVIVVEDIQEIREQMVKALNLLGHRAAGAGSALEFYRALGEGSYSIAVVDLGLPDHCGYQLTEYIRRNTAMGVIILTGRNAIEDRVRGYNAGADLYMVKPVDYRELAAAIANLGGRLVDRPPQARVQPPVESWQLQKESWRLLAPSGAAIALTAKEMRFMECLAQEPGTAVSRTTLLTALGYRDDEYAHRALDSLVRRLRRKIEACPSLHPPIKTIHATGYCFSAPITIC